MVFYYGSMLIFSTKICKTGGQALNNTDFHNIYKKAEQCVTPVCSGMAAESGQILPKGRVCDHTFIKYAHLLQVADIGRLMDDGKIRSAQDYRHKVNIAYRTSHINEDKFRVLTHHNPLPQLGYMENQESVSAYMPSWTQLPVSTDYMN